MRFSIIVRGILISILVLVALLYVWGNRQYSGRISHPYEQYGEVQISRDEIGVAHIKGKTYKSVAFGHGYAQAQDRLFQIILKTKVAKGQMSEIKGESGLAFDIFFRTLGIHRVAKQLVEQQTKEELEVLQAFCDGINFYYHSLLLKPFEFVVAQIPWEDFTPVDVLVNERLMFLLLGYDSIWEPIRSNLAKQFGQKTAREITAASASSQFVDVTITNDEELQAANLYEKYQAPIEDDSRESSDLIDSSVNEVLRELLEVPNGSNAWVIHGNHTKSGKPLLANDPHLQNSIPAPWVQTEIIVEDHNVVAIGASIPGLLFVQTGRTDYVAWGTTVLFADTADLYKEEIVGNTYKLNGEWKELNITTEKIRIKGSPKHHTLEIKSTHRGPVMDFKFDKFSPNPLIDIGMNVSMCWNGHSVKSSLVSSLQKMYESKSLDDVVKAFGSLTGPALSAAYATADGHIGFYGYGRIPVTKDSSKGAFVKDGTTTEFDWIRFTTPEEAPQMVDPSKGYIVTANNRFSSDNMVNHLAVNQLSTARSLRIVQMIEEQIASGVKFDANDMKRMQADTLDAYAQIAVPQLIQLFKQKAVSVLSAQHHVAALKMIDELEQWNYRMEINSYRASIFMAWEYLFASKCLHAFKTSDLERKSVQMGLHFEHFYFSQIRNWANGVDSDFDKFWCRTISKEGKLINCLENIFLSFSEIPAFLSAKFSTSEVLKWRWGSLHISNYDHAAFAKVPLLNRLYNRRIECFGNRRTVAVSIQNWRIDSFETAYGSNLRLIADMDEKGKDYWVIDMGSNENVFSTHYDDQFKAHHKFEYFEMNRGLQNLANHSHVLTLSNTNPKSDNSSL